MPPYLTSGILQSTRGFSPRATIRPLDGCSEKLAGISPREFESVENSGCFVAPINDRPVTRACVDEVAVVVNEDREKTIDTRAILPFDTVVTVSRCFAVAKSPVALAELAVSNRSCEFWLANLDRNTK